MSMKELTKISHVISGKEYCGMGDIHYASFCGLVCEF